MAKIKTKYTLRPDGRIVATKTINGKKKYFYGDSDEEVEQKMDAYLHPEAHGRTVQEVADIWWKEKQKEISPNSYYNFFTPFSRFCARFGEAEIKDVTMYQILEYLEEFRDKQYSTKVISKQKTVINEVMDKAIHLKEFSHNPVDDLPPVLGKKKVPRKIAPDEDIRKLEEIKNESLMAKMWYIAIWTGLRRGELIALTEDEIDRDKRQLHIYQSCAYKASDPVIKGTKTDAGTRTVPIPQNAFDVLPQKNIKAKYIFFPDGIPQKSNLERHLHKFQQEHNLSCTLHQLRHFFSSVVFESGLSEKDHQNMIGHTTIQMSMDTYTHLRAMHNEEASRVYNEYAEKLSEKLSKTNLEGTENTDASAD